EIAGGGPLRRELPFELGAGKADLTLGDRLVELDHLAATREIAARRGLVGDVAEGLDAILDPLFVVFHAREEPGGLPAEGVGRAILDLGVHAAALLGVVVP